MQSLPFGSKILGLSTFKESLAVCTESDGIFIVSILNGQIKYQIPLPSFVTPTSAPVWSKDGDLIWIPAGKFLHYTKPSSGATFSQIEFQSNVNKIFPHSDGISVIAILDNQEIRYVKAKQEENQVTFGPFESDERIISAVIYQKKLYITVDCKAPYLCVLDPTKFTEISRIKLEQRQSSSIFTSLSSDFGVVTFWSDGYWQRYSSDSNANASSSGKISAASDMFLIGSHVGCVTEDQIKIFDLKFSAELQSFSVTAEHIALFSSKCAISVDAILQIRDWKGIAPTTSLSLIGTNVNTKKSKKNKREEISLEIQYNEELNQPTTCDVGQKPAQFKVKSLKHAVESVMEDRFVSQDARQKALKLANEETEQDQKDLAIFQLLPTIPYDYVKQSIIDKKFDTAQMLLKKVEVLTAEQTTELIRMLMNSLDENEIVLAHIITQPTSDSVLNDSVRALTAEESDHLLFFLAHLIKSRRFWKDFEASLSAFDAASRWASSIISLHSTVLTLENHIEGMKALKEELLIERQRIEKAGECWAILHNVCGSKQSDAPPNFMYIVEKLEIPDSIPRTAKAEEEEIKQAEEESSTKVEEKAEQVIEESQPPEPKNEEVTKEVETVDNQEVEAKPATKRGRRSKKK